MFAGTYVSIVESWSMKWDKVVGCKKKSKKAYKAEEINTHIAPKIEMNERGIYLSQKMMNYRKWTWKSSTMTLRRASMIKQGLLIDYKCKK